MPVSPQTDAQLASAAHAADRKNRPLIVIVVPIILLLGATAYAIASYYIMRSQGRQYATFETIRANTEEDYEKILDVRADFPKLDEQFPKYPYFVPDVKEYAEDVLAHHGVEANVTTTDDNRRWPLASGDKPLVQQEATATLSDAPLIAVLDFIERVLTDPDRKYEPSGFVENVFLEKIRLTPMSNSAGWTAHVTFESLQYDPRR